MELRLTGIMRCVGFAVYSLLSESLNQKALLMGVAQTTAQQQVRNPQRVPSSSFTFNTHVRAALLTKRSRANSTADILLGKALLASYKASYEIARYKKPHTIGEELSLPASIKIVETMFGDNFAKKLEQPLSNDTVACRIASTVSRGRDHKKLFCGTPEGRKNEVCRRWCYRRKCKYDQRNKLAIGRTHSKFTYTK
ncbi:unnamed protein product [Acanthoscelides obtectus]|uniref:Uncharacterized protein n=1 Tax=Acanthoscelides obtectus TaxID=200917 RepID=A0A9P0K583_ACAOB|nr:unnamed protein product [Acanthoscelides obtectus]CAK1649384.1 Protein FAM200A [Acanthoscelides obtectus]